MAIAITRAAPSLIGYALGFDNCFLPETANTTIDEIKKGIRNFPIQNEI